MVLRDKSAECLGVQRGRTSKISSVEKNPCIDSIQITKKALRMKREISIPGREIHVRGYFQ